MSRHEEKNIKIVEWPANNLVKSTFVLWECNIIVFLFLILKPRVESSLNLLIQKASLKSHSSVAVVYDTIIDRPFIKMQVILPLFGMKFVNYFYC